MADLFDILLAKNLAGGGDSAIVYTSIIDNGDNTITATDDKGVEHIISYVVGADDKITSITLDGKMQSVTYEGDVLVKIGNTDVNMESVPIAEEGASLNIAYGQTAPEDTSKLWIKANEPSNLEFGYNLENGVENLYSLTETLPTDTTQMASAVVGTKIYLFGGRDRSGNGLNSINVFDTTDNSISTLSTTLPQGAYSISAVSIGNDIYLFGGRSGSSYLNSINIFHTTDNSISSVPITLPQGAYSISAVSIGNDIYLFGGVKGSSSYLNSINIFHTTDNSISSVPITLPQGAYNISAVVYGQKIYLVGGYGSSSIKKIYVFNVEDNSITQLTDQLPYSTTAGYAQLIGNKIYIFYDNGIGTEKHNPIGSYDLSTNTLQLLTTTLPITQNNSISSAVVGTKIYLFGGQNGSGVKNVISVFNLTFPLSNGDIFVQEDFTKNRFDILSSPTEVSIGVRDVFIGNEDDEAEKAEAYIYDEDTEQWELI